MGSREKRADLQLQLIVFTVLPVFVDVTGFLMIYFASIPSLRSPESDSATFWHGNVKRKVNGWE